MLIYLAFAIHLPEKAPIAWPLIVGRMLSVEHVNCPCLNITTYHQATYGIIITVQLILILSQLLQYMTQVDYTPLLFIAYFIRPAKRAGGMQRRYHGGISLLLFYRPCIVI